MGKTVKWTLFALLLIACWGISIRYQVDFRVFHAAARLAARGELGTIYTREILQESTGRFFNGPLFVALLEPLGYFSYSVAQYLWVALQTVFFFGVWISLNRLYPWVLSSKLDWGWILFFAVAVNPLHLNFQSGNIQLLLGALIFGAEALARSERKSGSFWAGVLVAVAAAIKVYPGFIALYYLLFRSRETKRGVVAGVGIAVLIPLLTFGPSATWMLHRDFLANMGTYGAENSLLTAVDMLCLPAIAVRSLTPYIGEAISLQLGKVASLLVALVFFVLLWRKRSQLRVEDPRSLGWWALACGLMTFINPTSRPHYFVFYLPLFASLIELVKTSASRAYAVGLAVSFTLFALTMQGVVGKALNDRLENWNVPTLGTAIGLLTILIALLQKPGKQIT